MSKQVAKSFTTLVLGFLVGISAAEIYHMEKQPVPSESCTGNVKSQELAISKIAVEKFSVMEVPDT